MYFRTRTARLEVDVIENRMCRTHLKILGRGSRGLGMKTLKICVDPITLEPLCSWRTGKSFRPSTPTVWNPIPKKQSSTTLDLNDEGVITCIRALSRGLPTSYSSVDSFEILFVWEGTLLLFLRKLYIIVLETSLTGRKTCTTGITFRVYDKTKKEKEKGFL